MVTWSSIYETRGRDGGWEQETEDGGAGSWSFSLGGVVDDLERALRDGSGSWGWGRCDRLWG